MYSQKKRCILRLSSLVWCSLLLLALVGMDMVIDGTTVQAANLQLHPNSASGMPLGIAGDPRISYAGIGWVRIGYKTCGGNMHGDALRDVIQRYHQQGIRVMLSVCQWSNTSTLFDTSRLLDAAASNPDAVQCGNEQMKDGKYNLYVTPERFARFYDNCEHIMHAARPGIPIILGALDPHVGGIDYWPLVQQKNYLDAMQYAMNTQVHPHGHWTWRSQIVGLIDSWHNGYPAGSVNSLYGLFVFWAKAFNVNLNRGELGKHMWVIEGTGCFKGCGINANSKKEVAVSHVITLITDVQTTQRYNVPFFYFSGTDFVLENVLWPLGVMTVSGHAKPLRQDLAMGARVLKMTCGKSKVNVQDQEQLLAKMYAGCQVPDNYYGILAR